MGARRHLLGFLPARRWVLLPPLDCAVCGRPPPEYTKGPSAVDPAGKAGASGVRQAGLVPLTMAPRCVGAHVVQCLRGYRALKASSHPSDIVTITFLSCPLGLANFFKGNCRYHIPSPLMFSPKAKGCSSLTSSTALTDA